MKDIDKPFLLVEANTTVRKASLAALIQRKIQSGKEYPATVSDLVNGVAFVSIEAPILRSIKEDQPQAEIASIISIHSSNVRVGDHVSLHHSGGEWKITTSLSPDVFQEKLETGIRERLLLEASITATPSKKRGSKRSFEQWLQIPPSESTPWAIPGRLSEGQKLLSRKILSWCTEKGGEQFNQSLQFAFPSIKDWGHGMQYFGVFINAENDGTFESVALAKEEHKALTEAWWEILQQYQTPQYLTKPAALAQTNTQPLQHSSRYQTGLTAQPQPQTSPITSVINASVPIQPLFTLPTKLVNTIKSFNLPLPAQPISDTMATLAAWTQSDHPELQSRSTDFLLMILSGGDPIRNASAVTPLWMNWHTETDTINKLCTLIQPGEEGAAIRGLVSHQNPNPIMAASLSDQLLLRWRRRLVQSHNLSLSDLNIAKPEMPELKNYRRAMRLRGLQCADTWLDRLLLCCQTAPEMGMILLLRGSESHVQCILEILSDVFEHATSDIVRMPRKRTQLFGKPSLSGDIFLPSDFTLAVRKGGYRERYGELAVWNPHFILLEQLSPFAKKDGLSLTLQQMYFGDGIRLYSEEDNQKFQEEYTDLQSRSNLSPQQKERRDQLEDFFAVTHLGGREIEDAWRLYASSNTVIMGHLDASISEEWEITKRALILEVPNFSVADVQSVLSKRRDSPKRITEVPRRRNPQHTWNLFPQAREQILDIVHYLQPCNVQANDLLAKQISFLLAGAEAWQIPDSPLLCAHIVETLVFPRISCKGSVLLSAIEEIQQLPHLAPQLQSTLGMLKAMAHKYRHETVHGLQR